MYALVVLALLLAPSRAVAQDPGRDGALDSAAEAPSAEDEDFRAKLDTLLSKVDKSAALTREQIAGNPGAPFLPDLYLQLAELLAQKADALYYIEMEHRKKSGSESTSDPAHADQVVRALQEDAQVLRLLDHDYPAYAKRPKVLLMLAAGQKMAGEKAHFKATAERLTGEFPASIEAAKARLLLGEMYFDMQGYDEAQAAVRPLLTNQDFPYERDAAKYRTALCFVLKEKFRLALDLFAEVASDATLETQNAAAHKVARGQAAGQDILEGGGRLDLKREALLDSLRAYTRIYPHGEQDPIPYYSELAPTELYFQEVIEKLAYRYISLKEIRTGVRLLRALSERLREPPRVVRIYVDVLSHLTPEDRYRLEPSEIAYVLEDLRLWLEFYLIEPGARKKTEDYFEKQLRELGTAAHDRAKGLAPASALRATLLERAVGFYELYLAYFRSTKYRVKMAMNLADAYYLEKRFKDCGGAYLRVYQNEFGAREQPEKVIQSAIVCLQSDKSDGFYDQVRARGLLIRAIRDYQSLKPAVARDPKIAFALLKAYYDQGAYGQAIEGLYQFMRRNRASPQAVSAGELILDYHNTRSDLQGLKAAAERMLSFGLADQAFVGRLRTMRKQVALKKLYERVDVASARADSSRGETYLAAALSSGDEAVKDVALQQALAASRAEGNLEIYLKTAGVLLSKERNAETRAQLYSALASENLRVGRYYRALALLESAAAETALSTADRDRAWDQAVNLAITLRDPVAVVRLLQSPSWSKTGLEVQGRAGVFLAELIDGRRRLPDSAITVLSHAAVVPGGPGLGDDLRSAFFRYQFDLGAGERKRFLSALETGCAAPEGTGAGPVGAAAAPFKGTACAWLKLNQIESSHAALVNELRTSQAGVDGLESLAKKLEALTSQYAQLEGYGEPGLDAIRLIRLAEVYQSFGLFLNRLAGKNADLKTVLVEKAKEALGSAKKSKDSCANLPLADSPAARFCNSATGASFAGLLHARLTGDYPWEKRGDSLTDETAALEKKLFVKNGDRAPLLQLGVNYLSSGQLNAAMAAGVLGAGSPPDDFEALLVCAARGLGLTRESTFHARKASEFRGYRARCTKAESPAAEGSEGPE